MARLVEAKATLAQAEEQRNRLQRQAGPAAPAIILESWASQG